MAAAAFMGVQRAASPTAKATRRALILHEKSPRSPCCLQLQTHALGSRFQYFLLPEEHTAAVPLPRKTHVGLLYAKLRSGSPGWDSPTQLRHKQAGRPPPRSTRQHAAPQPRAAPGGERGTGPRPSLRLAPGRSRPRPAPRSPKMPCTMLKGLLSQSATHGMAGEKRAKAAAASPAPRSRRLPLASPARGPRTSALRLLLLLFLSERPQQWRRDPNPPFPLAPPFSSCRARSRGRHLKGGRDKGGRGRAAVGKGRGRGAAMAAAKPGSGTNLLFASSATEFNFTVPFIPVSQAPAAPPGPALLTAGMGCCEGRALWRVGLRGRFSSRCARDSVLCSAVLCSAKLCFPSVAPVSL